MPAPGRSSAGGGSRFSRAASSWESAPIAGITFDNCERRHCGGLGQHGASTAVDARHQATLVKCFVDAVERRQSAASYQVLPG